MRDWETNGVVGLNFVRQARADVVICPMQSLFGNMEVADGVQAALAIDS